MKKIQPEIDAIRIKYKDNKQEQALKTMALYKEKGVSPFSGIVLTLIQLPILIALYMVFYKNSLGQVNTDLLYSFIHAPEYINTVFIGLFDITQKNTILAVLVAVGQYFQIKYTMPATPAVKKGEEDKKDTSFQSELTRSMGVQMKYVLPIMMFFIANSFAALISLYLITSSVFSIGQEIYMRKKIALEDSPTKISKSKN
jgi:YidC/Oxa1 family membrane protein insertase